VYVCSEETKKKLSESNRGKTLTEEHKQKVREARKHQIFTEETKKKLSLSHQGNIPGNARAVKTPLGIYSSIKKASQAHKIAHKTMLNWLNTRKDGFEYMAPTF
jgi:hypothetical protein